MNNAYLTAKRYIAESIYHMTKLDGLNTTFPETKSLIDGGVVANMDLHDVTVITNLKRAWEMVLNDSYNSENDKTLIFSVDYFKKINSIVGRDLVINAGELRTTVVGIGNYTPPVPNDEFISKKLDEIKNCDDPIQQALEVLCFGIKSQNFYDANKRTSFMVANYILIKNDIGIIYVNESKYQKFNELLSDFLIDNNVEPLKDFFYTSCIEFQPTYEVKGVIKYASKIGYVSTNSIVKN